MAHALDHAIEIHKSGAWNLLGVAPVQGTDESVVVALRSTFESQPSAPATSRLRAYDLRDLLAATSEPPRGVDTLGFGPQYGGSGESRRLALMGKQLLPDVSLDVDRWVELISSHLGAAAMQDDQIEIEELMLFGAAESSVDTDLYRTLESVTLSHYPGAGFGPSVSTGFTDSHFFRDIGVASYGYSPMVTPIEFVGGVHGNNERIEIAAFEKGIEVMIDVLTEFAGPVAD